MASDHWNLKSLIGGNRRDRLCRGLEVTTDPKKTRVIVRLDCELKIWRERDHSRFTRGRTLVIVQMRKSIFTSTSDEFCDWTSILKLEMIIFVIHNCSLDEAIPNPIQRPKTVCGVGSAHSRATYLKPLQTYGCLKENGDHVRPSYLKKYVVVIQSFLFYRTTAFDWCVVWWELKNNHHKGTCLKESGGLCLQLYQLHHHSTLNSKHVQLEDLWIM